jgi:hypothetical protein
MFGATSGALQKVSIVYNVIDNFRDVVGLV